jgi:hypothetical protein
MFVTYCAPILYRHWHCLLIGRSEIPNDPCDLGAPSGASKMISEPMVRSTQTVHISCVKISNISEWTKLSLEPYHQWLSSSASEMIFESMVHLAHTVHLSCTNTNTIFKRKEERFHMTHVTQEIHPHPKWFLSLWYVRCKPCTYLASRLALSPNGPSFHLSLITSEYHRVRRNQFLCRWYVWRKLCIYRAPTLTLSLNRKKWDSTWPTSPRSSIGCVQNDF